MAVWSRRTLLKAALAAGAAWPLRASAFGDASRLVFAQIRHGGRWDPRPRSLPPPVRRSLLRRGAAHDGRCRGRLAAALPELRRVLAGRRRERAERRPVRDVRTRDALEDPAGRKARARSARARPLQVLLPAGRSDRPQRLPTRRGGD